MSNNLKDNSKLKTVLELIISLLIAKNWLNDCRMKKTEPHKSRKNKMDGAEEAISQLPQKLKPTLLQCLLLRLAKWKDMNHKGQKM